MKSLILKHRYDIIQFYVLDEVFSEVAKCLCCGPRKRTTAICTIFCISQEKDHHRQFSCKVFTEVTQYGSIHYDFNVDSTRNSIEPT